MKRSATDSVAMVLRRGFPDVESPVQHGVRKVRLRLMLHSWPKVSPLLLCSKEESLFSDHSGSRKKRSLEFRVSKHICL